MIFAEGYDFPISVCMNYSYRLFSLLVNYLAMCFVGKFNVTQLMTNLSMLIMEQHTPRLMSMINNAGKKNNNLIWVRFSLFIDIVYVISTLQTDNRNHRHCIVNTERMSCQFPLN